MSFFCLHVYIQDTGGAHLTAGGHTLTGGTHLTDGAEGLIRPKKMHEAGLEPTTSRLVGSHATAGLERDCCSGMGTYLYII